jgi:hypothetical protein
MKAMFGKQGGGIPKDVRAELGYAVDAINAHQRGLSVNLREGNRSHDLDPQPVR